MGVAAAVEEEDSLFFLVEGLFEVMFEDGGEDVEAAAFLGLGFHIDGDDAGHFGAQRARAQGNQTPVGMMMGIVPGFEDFCVHPRDCARCV